MFWSFVIILIINLRNKLQTTNKSIFELENIKIKSKKFLWYLIMPINILIICTLMSTKDMRFYITYIPLLMFT